jgi:glyoxylase-like metal-dependent hydrolase (beta-lactamase superfamily II)
MWISHIHGNSELKNRLQAGFFLVVKQSETFHFETALESVGITPEDVDLVIQTHLHNDHCENTYKCKNARVIVQRAEYEFARNPHPLDH